MSFMSLRKVPNPDFPLPLNDDYPYPKTPHYISMRPWSLTNDHVLRRLYDFCYLSCDVEVILSLVILLTVVFYHHPYTSCNDLPFIWLYWWSLFTSRHRWFRFSRIWDSGSLTWRLRNERVIFISEYRWFCVCVFISIVVIFNTISVRSFMICRYLFLFDDDLCTHLECLQCLSVFLVFRSLWQDIRRFRCLAFSSVWLGTVVSRFIAKRNLSLLIFSQESLEYTKIFTRYRTRSSTNVDTFLRH